MKGTEEIGIVDGETQADATWYQRSAEAALAALGVDPSRGLSDVQATKRQGEYGLNELEERAGRSRFRILLAQLTGVLTLILIGAAVVSVFLGDVIDAVVILAIVVLNAALGFSQEYRAEQSMAALKRLAVPTVRVKRDGTVRELSARELVPGDIVLVEAGNIVAADGRLLEGFNLRAQESALTGEAEAVDKDAEWVFEVEKPVGDRRNMLYAGTVITYGHGEMLVTATGMATELGHIAEMIQSVSEDLTPLQRRLDRLGKMLAAAAMVLVVVIFVLGLLRGEAWEEMLLTSVSLAVAAIPEALTAVVTIALSLGAQRMLRRQALIRKLPAVETLGSVSVICSDKTGTLTQNRMTVTALDVANHRVALRQRPGEVHLSLEPEDGQADRERLIPTLDLLLIGGALCNDALLVTPEHGDDTPRAVGDPTEGSLVLAAAGFGIRKPDLDRTFKRVAEVPFDSVRKRMTTVHRMPQAGSEIPDSLRPMWERRHTTDIDAPYIAFTKGALDSLLERTTQVWVEGDVRPLDDSWRQRVQAAHDGLAENGMRVMGVGVRLLDERPPRDPGEGLEQELVLIGLFGLMDPPRPEVAQAVARCKQAGIHPVMITGDHPLTARHIAQVLGFESGDRFTTGQELDRMTPEALIEETRQVSVFARVSPEHKLRLVEAFRQRGETVAMTGDGVNDAPALKKADIGVAMGITGTDVSKEAAEMVLLDDNFATIVAAIEEGRVIYDNIRRFIKYLLTCNASEIAVMLLGPFLGMPLPLLPLQILWMNLVTDGLPALALSVEPAEADVMQRRPISSQESIFGRGMVAFIVAVGVAMSLLSVAVGVFAYRSGHPAWQTLLFTTLIFSQLALALEVRSEANSLFHIGLQSNRPMLAALGLTVLLQFAVIYLPFLQRVFNTQPLGASDLGIAFGAGMVVILVVELWKAYQRGRARNRTAATG
jgi:Ca2+-transporting ATPase